MDVLQVKYYNAEEFEVDRYESAILDFQVGSVAMTEIKRKPEFHIGKLCSPLEELKHGSRSFTLSLIHI